MSIREDQQEQEVLSAIKGKNETDVDPVAAIPDPKALQSMTAKEVSQEYEKETARVNTFDGQRNRNEGHGDPGVVLRYENGRVTEIDTKHYFRPADSELLRVLRLDRPELFEQGGGRPRGMPCTRFGEVT